MGGVADEGALRVHCGPDGTQRAAGEKVAAGGGQEQFLVGPPRWITVDVQGESVRRYVVPIERAMDLIVQENNGGRR
ncbi:MAG: hypothetical protein IH797_04585 [Chloroflexi bacterium]|nr:hypothetical protein [Chloroflexota bacterium]